MRRSKLMLLCGILFVAGWCSADTGKEEGPTELESLLSRFVSCITRDGDQEILVCPKDRAGGWMLHDGQSRDVSPYRTIPPGGHYRIGPGDSKSLFVLGGVGTLTMSVTNRHSAFVAEAGHMETDCSETVLEILFASRGRIRKFTVNMEDGTCLGMEQRRMGTFKFPYFSTLPPKVETRANGMEQGAIPPLARELHLRAKGYLRLYSTSGFLSRFAKWVPDGGKTLDLGLCHPTDVDGGKYWDTLVLDVGRNGTNLWVRGVGEFDTRGNERVFLFTPQGHVGTVSDRNMAGDLRIFDYGNDGIPVRTYVKEKGVSHLCLMDDSGPSGTMVTSTVEIDRFVENARSQSRRIRETAQKLFEKVHPRAE